MTNCNDATTTLVAQKMKDRSKKYVPCPVAINFYNQATGEVDHAYQMITLYDLDKKSQKWWRKWFFHLPMTAVHNAYLIYCKPNTNNFYEGIYHIFIDGK